MSRAALVAIASAAVAGLLSADRVVAADAAHPSVIELYQSQGCSSCPPANALLNRLSGRPDLLPLSFAVTYWDQLGWKDTFATPEYTQRQWDYAAAQDRGGVATPQFVVNGRAILSGGSQSELVAALRETDRGRSGPVVSANGRRVTIGAGDTARPATVWLVRYDPRERLVAVGRGENGGRKLPHRNIVTALRAVAKWSGKPISFDQPLYRDPGQRSAVLVQQGRGGPIVAAARL